MPLQELLLETPVQERSRLVHPGMDSKGYPSSMMPAAGCGPPPNPASLLRGELRLKGLQLKQQHTLAKSGNHQLHHNKHHHQSHYRQTYEKQQHIWNNSSSTNNESAVDSRARQAHDSAAYHGLGPVPGPSLCEPSDFGHHHFVPYRVERAPSQRRYGHLYELERLPAALGGHHDDLGDEPLVPVRVLVCCLCGVLLAVLLLYLLYEYVRQQTELSNPPVDADNLEFFNAVYSHRVAQIIRTAASEVPPPRTPSHGWTHSRGVVATPYLAQVLGSGVKLLGPDGSWGVVGGGGRKGLAAELAAASAGNHMSWLHGRQTIKLCHLVPPLLVGNVSADVNHEHATLTLGQVQATHADLAPGGEWRPPDCVARYRMAIVIPYRDRLAHLTVLLAHLLPILKRQQLHFRIFVVEQHGNLTFNKGRIMNAAFKEALKMYDFQCVVFHDVDLIPEDDRNMYTCPAMPRHMSVAIDEMNYSDTQVLVYHAREIMHVVDPVKGVLACKHPSEPRQSLDSLVWILLFHMHCSWRLKYTMLVGGVLNLRVEHFQQVNGYSNMYWGWGAEDDDMAYRILHVGLKIFRPPATIARYQMIKHEKRKPTSWDIRGRLLRTAVKRYHLDGLNSVQYTVNFIHTDPLYTHIMVDIGKPWRGTYDLHHV